MTSQLLSAGRKEVVSSVLKITQGEVEKNEQQQTRQAVRRFFSKASFCYGIPSVLFHCCHEQLPEIKLGRGWSRSRWIWHTGVRVSSWQRSDWHLARGRMGRETSVVC